MRFTDLQDFASKHFANGDTPIFVALRIEQNGEQANAVVAERKFNPPSFVLEASDAKDAPVMHIYKLDVGKETEILVRRHDGSLAAEFDLAKDVLDGVMKTLVLRVS